MLKSIPSYIVVEGPDGSGKDTIVKFLKENNDLNADFYREPDIENPIGKIIRKDILSGDVYSDYQIQGLLFTSDRYLIQRTKMKESWERGRNIISNRSFVSTIAYQITEDLPFNRILIELQSRVIAPDMILFAAVDPETIIERKSRMNDRKEIFENKDFLRELSLKYLISLYITKALFPSTDIVYVDSRQSKEDMKEEALEKVSNFIGGEYQMFEDFTPWGWHTSEQFPSLHNARVEIKEKMKSGEEIEVKKIFYGGLKSAAMRKAIRDFIYNEDKLIGKADVSTFGSKVREGDGIAVHSVLDGFLHEYEKYEDVMGVRGEDVRRACENFFEKNKIHRINPAYPGNPYIFKEVL
ncbi:MAG: dTMP kinase [Candidatus Aenigmarchaeota archaeon]|nr:dTMP kinase [Candidatus Aenigmarchaeota archaeon]